VFVFAIRTSNQHHRNLYNTRNKYQRRADCKPKQSCGRPTASSKELLHDQAAEAATWWHTPALAHP